MRSVATESIVGQWIVASYAAHKFALAGRKGYALSQSFEESGEDPRKAIAKHRDRDLFVVAARPRSEDGSCLETIREIFDEFGFRVREVEITHHGDDSEYYDASAREVFDILQAG